MRKGIISIILSVIVLFSVASAFTISAAAAGLATPIISSAYVNNAGTVIKWGKVKGAQKYRVYYRIGNSRWTKITDTASTSCIWSGAKSGTKYTFTVRCITADGKAYASGFDSFGKTVTKLSSPKLTSVANTTDGVKLSWNKVSGAEKYRVFRKTSGKSWTAVGTTTALSFTDKNVKPATKYIYTVRCVSKNANSYTSGFDTAGKSITFISASKISSVYVNNAGAVIQWNKVAGASKYRVFYKIGNGSWVKIADTASSSYTWSGAKSSVKYTFTVRCVTSDGKSYASSFYSSGKTITVLPAPKNISAVNTTAGIKLNWSKVSGAGRYRVFRKASGASSWSAVATTTALSYTDKNVKSSATYSYTVRCIDKSTNLYTSGFNASGKSIKFVSAPKISSVYINNSGAVIQWNKVSGISKYRVFYRVGNGSWTKIADTTFTSYTWTGVKTSTKYYFTVRCLNSDGNSYASSFYTGNVKTFLPDPKISSIRAVNSGTEINIAKVSGAVRYKVFRKTSSAQSWSSLGTTTSTTFVDKKAAKGTKYIYTARCLSSDGKTYLSGYSETGKSFTALSNPNISSLTATASGIQIKWGKVSKAEKYRVYRKTSGSGWVTLATTSSTSYVDKKAKSGNRYYYTIRCVSADAKVYTSGYNTSGKSISYVAAPKLTSVSTTSSGVKLKWGKVAGAAKYRVFRKVGSAKSWTAIGTTAYTNFTDVQVKKGTKYTYTVRCLNSSATSYISAYDTKGKSVTSKYTSSTKNDMVRVAEKQIGYSGGRKIWTWAGYSKRVPWCNLFITWCADQLGYYDSGRIPLYQAPKNTAKWFKSKGLFKNRSYVPKAGDLIFFSLSSGAQPYHIGLVEKYSNGYVYTIEGNLNDVVKRGRYSHKGNIYIYGYATPDYGHN